MALVKLLFKVVETTVSQDGRGVRWHRVKLAPANGQPPYIQVDGTGWLTISEMPEDIAAELELGKPFYLQLVEAPSAEPSVRTPRSVPLSVPDPSSRRFL